MTEIDSRLKQFNDHVVKKRYEAKLLKSLQSPASSKSPAVPLTPYTLTSTP